MGLEHSVKKQSRGSKHIKEGRRVHVCGGEYKGRNGIIAAGIGPSGLRLRAIEPGMSKVRVRLDSGELITYDKNELNKLETQDRRDKGKQKRLEAQKVGQKKEAKLQRAKKQRLHQAQDRRDKGKQKRLEAQKGGQKKLEAKLQRAKKQRLHQSHLAKK